MSFAVNDCANGTVNKNCFQHHLIPLILIEVLGEGLPNAEREHWHDIGAGSPVLFEQSVPKFE